MTRNPGRFAGLLYVLTSIPGFFALLYVPSKLIGHGNATATAGNMAASERRFRLGIAGNVIAQDLFLWRWVGTSCLRGQFAGWARCRGFREGPQGLKPASIDALTARLKPCPPAKGVDDSARLKPCPPRKRVPTRPLLLPAELPDILRRTSGQILPSEDR
jgi:hypothetical protein